MIQMFTFKELELGNIWLFVLIKHFDYQTAAVSFSAEWLTNIARLWFDLEPKIVFFSLNSDQEFDFYPPISETESKHITELKGFTVGEGGNVSVLI